MADGAFSSWTTGVSTTWKTLEFCPRVLKVSARKGVCLNVPFCCCTWEARERLATLLALCASHARLLKKKKKKKTIEKRTKQNKNAKTQMNGRTGERGKSRDPVCTSTNKHLWLVGACCTNLFNNRRFPVSSPETDVQLFWFGFAMPWLTRDQWPSQEGKQNQSYLLANVLLWLAPVLCIHFQFWLVVWLLRTC